MRAQVLAAGQLHVPLGGPTRRADALQPGARAEVQPAPEHAVGPVPADSGLPPLQDFGIFLYIRDGAPDLALQFAGIVRDTNFALDAPQSRTVQ